MLAGLTWYEYLTGNDVTENPYQLDGISEADMKLLKQAAHYACSAKWGMKWKSTGNTKS